MKRTLLLVTMIDDRRLRPGIGTAPCCWDCWCDQRICKWQRIESVTESMGSINDGMAVLHECTVSKFSFSEWDATDMANAEC
jgi:hypothetical protein